MAELTPEQVAQGIFLDAAGNPTLPDGSPAFGGVLGAMSRGVGPAQLDSASAGPLFFPHGIGDVPAPPEGMTQNIVAQFGRAPNGEVVNPFWSDVTPAGDTTGTQTIYRWDNATDPRVNEWYGANATPVTGAGESVQSMIDMLQAIPNAGVGTSAGGAFTLHKQAQRDWVRMGGDPAEAHLQHHPFYAGEDMPSTDNWRLLPPPYQLPGYTMRNGVILGASGGTGGYPAGFHGRLNDAGQNSPVTGVYSPHLGPYNGYPASYGFRGINYGWPGSIWGWAGYNWDMV